MGHMADKPDKAQRVGRLFSTVVREYALPNGEKIVGLRGERFCHVSRRSSGDMITFSRFTDAIHSGKPA